VFLPFIDVLKRYCVVHAVAVGQDHRLLGTLNEGVYHYPLNGVSAQALERVFDTLCDHNQSTVGPRELEVMMGRKLQVPRASKHCAWFTFSQVWRSLAICKPASHSHPHPSPLLLVGLSAVM
jgi:predicted ATPase